MIISGGWCLIGAFENRCCRFADQADLLASFEPHKELIPGNRTLNEQLAAARRCTWKEESMAGVEGLIGRLRQAVGKPGPIEAVGRGQRSGVRQWSERIKEKLDAAVESTIYPLGNGMRFEPIMISRSGFLMWCIDP
jgi:hypothetical protein